MTLHFDVKQVLFPVKWNDNFPVKWHIVKDVPNSLLKYITLENNENKPVTNNRDTQEVIYQKNVLPCGSETLTADDSKENIRTKN